MCKCGSYPEIPLEEMPDADGVAGVLSLSIQEPCSPATSSEAPLKEGLLTKPPIYIPWWYPSFLLSLNFGVKYAWAGLGIWTKRKIEAGEKFGPYVGEQRSNLKDPRRWMGGKKIFWVNTCLYIKMYKEEITFKNAHNISKFHLLQSIF